MSQGFQKVKVRTKYFATLRDITGRREDSFEFDQKVDLKTFIDTMLRRYGERLTEFVIDKTGSIRESLTLLVNGQSVNSSDLGSVKLKDGDVVVILPPIGGG